MKEADIDYSDIAPLGKEFFTKATEAWPPVKQQLTIRLDADLLKWLKAHGRGYQTRINRILRAAMESQAPLPKKTRLRTGLAVALKPRTARRATRKRRSLST